MADHCSFCNTRRPLGGTKILVLNGGAVWAEFCQRCEDMPITNAITGEVFAIGTLFAESAGLPNPGIAPREKTFDEEFGHLEEDWLDREHEAYYKEWAKFEAMEEEERRQACDWYGVIEEYILRSKKRRLLNV